MKTIKKLISLGLFMTIITTMDIYSMARRKQGTNKKVTFNNQLGIDVTLTGPRGSRVVANGDQQSIRPLTNPVQYSIAAQGYETYSGKASAGKTYYICDDNGAIAVQDQACS